ncbi:hypothetical protein U14_05691 [Candidatus Moduliflexus flocculans]|uniref:Uncharacterized protein n=1 Tax=Candidatus Moduliflexus flocculans TaxID=1499966 RepID=A0A081BSM5_9BACT|nr:hypothetical protein U14_05691 [Candidatus Moduliflexus flocculans]
MTLYGLGLRWFFLLISAGLTSLLWGQTGMIRLVDFDPWNAQSRFFFTVCAIWLPAIYGFFSTVWWLLLRQDPAPRRFDARGDLLTYAGFIPFFGIMMFPALFSSPLVAINVLVFLLLLAKTLHLFEKISTSPHPVSTWILFGVSAGLYLFSIPFHQLSPTQFLSDLLNIPILTHLAILMAKAIVQALTALEIYRLSLTMVCSRRGAIFAYGWATCSFPILGFPRMSYLFAGLLFIFILRLIISRLDTRELIRGLLEPTSMMIGVKFAIFMMIIISASLIYWSNVKPGFNIHEERAYEMAIATLFDSQFGLLTLSPIFWLSFCGVVYLCYFGVWDGILLLISGGFLYGAYHLANYGILGKMADPWSSVSFLPFWAVLLAIAHHRFERFGAFKFGVVLLGLFTCVHTGILLTLYPDMFTIAGKIGEWQRWLMGLSRQNLGFYLLSFSFQRNSLTLWLCLSAILLLAGFGCYARTKSFAAFRSHQKHDLWQFTAFGSLLPLCVFAILGLSGWLSNISPRFYAVPLKNPLDFTIESSHEEISLAGSSLSKIQSRGLIVVSTLTNSVTLPQQKRLLNVTIQTTDQHFESFTLKAGKDTAELIADHPYLKSSLAHDRATIFRSWQLKTEDGLTYEGHDYYTILRLPRPMTIQEMKLKVFSAKGVELPPGIRIHIKQMFLLE